MPEIQYVGKPIGARRLTWWPIISDPEDGVTLYGPPVRLSRLITITPTPVLSEGLLESEDGVEDDLALVVAYDVAINASQLTDAIRAALLGHAIDEGGGVLTRYNDAAQEGALGWEELLSSKGGPAQYKKVVLYKGKFREWAETANTVVQSGVTYQTHNITGRFIKRASDGSIKYSLREDTPGASATKLAAWFDEPQEYGAEPGEAVATPAADPAAGEVALDSLVALSTATAGAVIRYTVNGTTPDATSTLYDGPILITGPMTIKARAMKSGMAWSDVLTAAYTIE